ncbi:hypothetical protein [uncultured Dechloromonas sp.]|uniref:hypothetical protein n=1 Tax=uncultured Dechloromonas sp. TaxID=171719 RepID=UPI0025FD9590|nr:hypothetical protein [uncultured Dechloromonas sp.]
MRHRNLFRGLVYDGDWHTRLCSALALARKGVESAEIMEAIVRLEDLLAQRDECVHKVSVSLDVPDELDPAHTHRQLFEELAAEQGELKLLVPRTLELTITLRGSRSRAEAEARGMLRRALTRHLAGIAFKRKLGD